VPGPVLAQLGNRVQQALRAFTPDDAKALKATVTTFPKSEFYDLEALLTQLGIGEAAVSILSESGVPTPVVHTKLRAPASRMGLPTTSTPQRRPHRSTRSTARASRTRTPASCSPPGCDNLPPPRKRPPLPGLDRETPRGGRYARDNDGTRETANLRALLRAL
jgi:hypothetical protein